MKRVRTLLGSLAQLPGGRRTKFAVIAVWMVVLFAIGPLAGKFEDAQENDPADYLPGERGVGEDARPARRLSRPTIRPMRSRSSIAMAG